ncbi:hypothetical protein RD792_008183 [Penstemon davidsonii]|uniref:Uncharacterized protein n=1 Tax=Penstemon davidsonii TaxID=160366 RepID=A0ABR0D9D9_9LAMI|nr:hypothetical protein RD792_008183 [Penstemon davidsonii]
MKFGKEFGAQMVPEWQEAYMDYELLKRALKEIEIFKQESIQVLPKSKDLRKNHTLYRAFSGLTQMVGNTPKTQTTTTADIENQVIVVNTTVNEDGIAGYETMFLMGADETGEKEMLYFNSLDEEFNKVLKFYRSKVDEVMKEASVLNKQMEALIAFRIKVENGKGWVSNFVLEETTKLASDVASSTAALSATTPSEARASSKRIHLDLIDEENSTTLRQEEESSDHEYNCIVDGKEENVENNNVGQRPAPDLEILENVKLNTSVGTPRSTIKGVLRFPNQTDLKFSKDNLTKAEEQLKKAFVEFYHKLRLLKSYSFLNILAFSKIMKKYDKIASRRASKPYLEMVDASYLGSSDEQRDEYLKAKSKKGKAQGFLVGCTLALILALALIIRARNILDHEGRVIYMETMFPLYSLFGFIVLHMMMYAGNIYFWRRYRVNYSFIFGFKQGTELGYREVLLVGFCLSVLALASVLANLDMEMDPVTLDYKALTELLPLGLVVLVIVTMICPFNIVYRSSRFFLLVCLFHCVLAPLYKVTLPDFFLADQLTSQVQALRSVQFYVCYYVWGDYKRRENTCGDSQVFNTLSFIVAGIPYWWRLLQCLRRLFEERDAMQGYNGLKYFLTIVAVSTRIAYTLTREEENNWWLVLAWVTSIIATIFSTYWDIVLDWGLLQPNSKNRWLRDRLLIPHKSVYFLAIVLNVLLRLAWMQTVLGITVFSLHRQTMVALVASLEIIRRGIWSFFRLENEHLNNVGKFRAFRSVPMPFNYDEDEGKDE